MKTSVKGFMFYVAFVASLGGLLFGFDTAVISGAEKAIQGIYALSDFAHGFTIATAIYIGPTSDEAPTANPPTKRKNMNEYQLTITALPTAEIR